MEFEKKVVELDVNDVLPNRFQPRIKFNEESINELSESIKEHGVIQPIVVRSMGDKYEIIAGERRYKASLLAGKTTIPAVITNLNDKDSAEVALIENVQRKDLTPIEEAISYKKILDMGYLTQEELAVKLGKSQSSVANKLRLLNLDEDVQDALLNEKISERHARSLLKLSDFSKQRSLLERIINERLTVRKTDEEIDKMLHPDSSNDETAGETKSLGPAFAENPFVINSLDPEVKETKFIQPQPIIIDDDILEQFSTVSEDDLSMDTIAQAPEAPTAPVDPVLGITVPTEPIVESPVESPVNPGFMNINNIENNAKDINVEVKKPDADLDSLLQTPAVPAVPEAATPEVAPAAPVEPELKPAKFFNLNAIEEEKKEETAAQAETPATSSTTYNNDPFNFGFTDAPSVPAPAAEEKKQDSVNKLDELLNSLSPAQTPAPAAAVEPKTEEVAPVASPATSEVAVEQVVPAEPVVPTEPVSVETTPVDLPVIQAAPESAPTIESITPAAPESLATAEESLELPGEEKPSVEVKREPLPSTPEVKAEAASVPTLTVEAPASSGNVINAVKDVRDLIQTLEGKGFKVNSEEFDFEQEYQVVIKIGK